MSVKYNNWYSWFTKSEENNTKQVVENHVNTKTGRHLINYNCPWELKVLDRELEKSLNMPTSKAIGKERKTSPRKSKTSLKVRKNGRKNISHNTQSYQKDAHININKRYKNESAPSSSSKRNRHFKSQLINGTEQYNSYKNRRAGNITAEKDSHREKRYENGKMIQLRTENSAVMKASRKEEQFENGKITQSRTENVQFKKESREKIKKIIDLTTSSHDEVRNSVGTVVEEKLSRKEEQSLLNVPCEKKLSSKPIRPTNPVSSEKLAKPVRCCLFSKVWPSDNSDEKVVIAEQSGQISIENNTISLHNKLNRVNVDVKQGMNRKTKTTSSNSRDSKLKSKKKGIIDKSNRILRFEDEDAKSKHKQSMNPKSICYKNNKNEKRNTLIKNDYKKTENEQKKIECNEKYRKNTNNKKVVFETDDKNDADYMDFISILKEIKSLKNQLNSLSDDDLKNSETATKNTRIKRKLECIDEEVVASSNTDLLVSNSDPQSVENNSPTISCEKEFHSDEVSSITVENPEQNSTCSKSVVCNATNGKDCQSTSELPSIINIEVPQAQANENLDGTIKTDLNESKDSSIRHCINCNGFQKQECNLFRNKRIFYFKSYIPASERKNKKEDLMKKRLLTRLRTYRIPIKRKLDEISSTNIRKIKCSSSSKENISIAPDRQATAYDFSPFLKQSFLLTSFVSRNSSANPFLPYSDDSRSTTTTTSITEEKVFSYICSTGANRRVKSESSLKFLKKPQDLTAKLQDVGNFNESVSKIKRQSIRLLGRKKRHGKQMKTKNKRKTKVIKKKGKSKQNVIGENHKDENVLKIENSSFHDNSVWKTIYIEFNDSNFNIENALPENSLQVMLTQITEHLKIKTVQINKFDLKDSNNDYDYGVKEINIPQHASDADKSEPFIESDVCLADFVFDDGCSSASGKSSQTDMNEAPSTSDIDIRNPYAEIIRQGKEIQVLHKSNVENKKEIEKIKDTCKIKFPWIEKVLFDILTQYQRNPTDYSSTRNIEQVFYSITNFTFLKSLSSSKNGYCKIQQNKKLKIFFQSSLKHSEKTIEYPTMESDHNSVEKAKNNEVKLFKKPKISRLTKNVRRFFRIFVGRKKPQSG